MVLLCSLQAQGCPSPSWHNLGGLPLPPPANPRTGSPQAPPPFSHAPFLNGAPQPTGHPEDPQGRDTDPKIGGRGVCATPRHQTSPGNPIPLGPPRPVPSSRTARLDGSGETQAKKFPPLRLLAFVRCFPSLGWLLRQLPLRCRDARPVGVRPSPSARPRRARAHGGHRAGSKLSFPASDLPAMNHCNLPPWFSPFLGSASEQKRSGFLENAAATDFFSLSFFFFFFFPLLSYSVPSGEAVSNPDAHTWSLAYHPLPRCSHPFHSNF